MSWRKCSSSRIRFKGVTDMILKLDTNNCSVQEYFEESEKNLSDSDRMKLEMYMAGLLVVAIAERAQSMYKSEAIQKIYVDAVAKYAKQMIDPEDVVDSSDLLDRAKEILYSVEEC